MRAALGRLQRIAQELLAQGTYTAMSEEAISGTAFRLAFPCIAPVLLLSTYKLT